MNPIRYRKYTFFLQLAGYLFKRINLIKYAENCSRISNQLFNCSKWTLIKHNIYLSLARNNSLLLYQKESQKFYLKALENIDIHDSKRKQKRIFEEIFFGINKDEEELVSDLLDIEG